MVIDIHTHIFPDDIRADRQAFFPSEPAFALIYNSNKSPMASADQLIASMDRHGVDKAVAFGFPWRSAELSKQHNDYVLASMQRFPDRLVGFCCLDPFNIDAEVEACRCIDAGMMGVGELGMKMVSSSSSVRWVMARRLRPVTKPTDHRPRRGYSMATTRRNSTCRSEKKNSETCLAPG